MHAAVQYAGIVNVCRPSVCLSVTNVLWPYKLHQGEKIIVVRKPVHRRFIPRERFQISGKYISSNVIQRYFLPRDPEAGS